MRTPRWTSHAREAIKEREIELAEVERTLDSPETKLPGQHGRTIYIRRYHDKMLHEDMLICAVVEERPDELVIVTVYKTSNIAKYLKGRAS